MISMLQLKYFQELAAQQNMTRVAEKHFVSQTALSNALSRMEEELNVPLFTRSGRSLILNEYGAIFLQYTNTILAALDDGIKALENQKRQNEGYIFVGTHNSLNWTRLVGEFMLNYPECTICHKECIPAVVAATLPNLDVDLIIAGTDDIVSPHLEHIEFRRDKIWLITPKNHPLARRTHVSLDELRDEPFIMQAKTSGFRKFCDKVLDEIGFTPKIVAECDYALRFGLLQQSSAVLLGSDTTKDGQAYGPDVAYLVIDEISVTRGISLFWKKGVKLSTGAQCFRDFVLRHYQFEEP